MILFPSLYFAPPDLIRPVRSAKCRIKNPGRYICSIIIRTGLTTGHDSMEEYVYRYLHYKVPRGTGIQNLLTDREIFQKVFFLT